MSTYAQIIDFLVAGLEDQNGNAFSGGKVDSYNAGLLTRKDTYTVRDKSALSTNPIPLDAYGRAVVYGDGLYKFVIKDADDNTIVTIDNYNANDDSFPGTPYVDVRDYASIDAAITDIGATVTTLVVSDARPQIGNLVFPSTLTLKILKGGSIVHLHPFTVTINGPFEAGPYQVFSGFSAGNVTFGNGKVKEVCPEWWATNTIPGTTDMIVALQSSVASIVAGNRVWGSNNYLISDSLTLKSGVALVGPQVDNNNDYRGGFRLTATGMAAAKQSIIIPDGSTSITLENFYIYRNSAATADEIDIAGDCNLLRINNVIIYSITTGWGINVSGTGKALIAASIENATISYSGGGIRTSTGSTSVTINSCYVLNTTTTNGAYLIQGTYINLIGCASDTNQWGYVMSVTNGGLYSCGAEANVKSAIKIYNSKGVTVSEFRSHINGTGADPTYGSFIYLDTSDYITVIGGKDSDPVAGVTSSITGNLDGGTYYPYLNITLINFNHIEASWPPHWTVRHTEINKKILYNGFHVFTNADTTPSVINGNFFECTNTGATTITKLDDGANGQQIIIFFGNSQTTLKATTGAGENLVLAGAVNFVATTDDVINLIFDGTWWREVSRSVN